MEHIAQFDRQGAQFVRRKVEVKQIVQQTHLNTHIYYFVIK